MLSLKLTLGALSAFAVAVVASVTLSIALTTSYSALRSLGTRHAEALLVLAERNAADMFARGSDAALAMANVTATIGAGVPSNASDPRVAGVADSATVSAFLRSVPDVHTCSLYFRGGYEVAVSLHQPQYSGNLPGDLYTIARKIPATPWDGTPGQHNTTFALTVNYYSALNNQLVATPAHLPPAQTNVSVHTQGLWDSLNLLTFNAFAPAFVAPRTTLANTGVDYTFVAVSVPVYDAELPQSLRGPGTVSAYVVVTVVDQRLRQFLLEARSTANTAAFAYDAQGFLVAATPDAPHTEHRPDTTNIPPGCSSTSEFAAAQAQSVGTHHLVCRKSLTEYDDPALNEIAESSPEILRPTTGAHPVRSLALKGGRVYAAATRVPLAFRGFELYLLLVMPEADVLGDVVTGRNVAIGVTCALVVLFAVLNVAVVMALLAPLSGIADRMNRAASFDDDGSDETVSAMAEVAELQLAYYAMNDELNRIRSYVPQSVLVAQRRAAGDNDGDDDDEDLNDHVTAGTSLSRVHSLDTESVSSRHSRQSHRTRGSKDRDGSSGAAYNAAASHHHAIAGLSQRAVTVVSGNLVGLHIASSRASAAGAADTVARHIERATTHFEEEVNANLGVMSFHGDRFLATFNAARPCASHASKALSTALALTVFHPDSDACRVACGVDTGRCVVGSMGSVTMKALGTVGPAVTNAAILEKHSRTRCAEAAHEGMCSRYLLASARSVSDAAVATALAVHCDIVALHTWTSERDTVVSWFVSKDEAAATTPTALSMSHDGGAPGAVTDSDQQGQEWLYAHDKATQHPVAVFNVPFEALAAGTTDAAAPVSAPFNDDGTPTPYASAPACVRERYTALASSDARATRNEKGPSRKN